MNATERLAELRQLAADRPAHAALLERMLAAADHTAIRPARGSGVTRGAHEALWADLDWIRWDSLRDGAPPFPGAYQRWRKGADYTRDAGRDTTARRAAARAGTR